MQKFDRKEITNLAMAFCALLFIPFSIWLAQPRALSAQTSAEMVALARVERQKEIMSQMQKRFEGENLRSDETEVTSDCAQRWRDIAAQMQEVGASANEAAMVTQTAQKVLPPEWPLMAERAHLRDQPVWIVLSSTPNGSETANWICPPSFAEKQQFKINRFCTNLQIAIISAEMPYNILN